MDLRFEIVIDFLPISKAQAYFLSISRKPCNLRYLVLHNKDSQELTNKKFKYDV